MKGQESGGKVSHTPPLVTTVLQMGEGGVAREVAWGWAARRGAWGGAAHTESLGFVFVYTAIELKSLGAYPGSHLRREISY